MSSVFWTSWPQAELKSCFKSVPVLLPTTFPFLGPQFPQWRDWPKFVVKFFADHVSHDIRKCLVWHLVQLLSGYSKRLESELLASPHFPFKTCVILCTLSFRILLKLFLLPHICFLHPVVYISGLPKQEENQYKKCCIFENYVFEHHAPTLWSECFIEWIAIT